MILLDKMLPSHWEEVKAIYEEGIATGHATFQTATPSWEEWDQSHLPACRVIAKEDDLVLGWAALTPVSGRCVYAGVAEVSVYVSAAARGKGLGRQLLQKLIEESEANQLWTLQSGIFPENLSSIKIHEACGFRIVGVRERIGQMNNIWRDNLLLERRSQLVGID